MTQNVHVFPKIPTIRTGPVLVRRKGTTTAPPVLWIFVGTRRSAFAVEWFDSYNELHIQLARCKETRRIEQLSARLRPKWVGVGPELHIQNGEGCAPLDRASALQP